MIFITEALHQATEWASGDWEQNTGDWEPQNVRGVEDIPMCCLLEDWKCLPESWGLPK